jgi:hypothetical protein
MTAYTMATYNVNHELEQNLFHHVDSVIGRVTIISKAIHEVAYWEDTVV